MIQEVNASFLKNCLYRAAGSSSDQYEYITSSNKYIYIEPTLGFMKQLSNIEQNRQRMISERNKEYFAQNKASFVEKYKYIFEESAKQALIKKGIEITPETLQNEMFEMMHVNGFTEFKSRNCIHLSEQDCKKFSDLCQWNPEYISKNEVKIKNKKLGCRPINLPIMSEVMKQSIIDETAKGKIALSQLMNTLKNAIIQARTPNTLHDVFISRVALDVTDTKMYNLYNLVARSLENDTVEQWVHYGTNTKKTQTYTKNVLTSCDDKRFFTEIFCQIFYATFFSKKQDRGRLYVGEDSAIDHNYIKEEFTFANLWKYIIQSVSDLMDTTFVKNHHVKPYILSKPNNTNMTWHIDKNIGNKTDVVMYIILGPLDSYSIFHTLYTENTKAREVLEKVDQLNSKTGSQPIQLSSQSGGTCDFDKDKVCYREDITKIDLPANLGFAIFNILEEEDLPTDTIDEVIDSIHMYRIWAKSGDLVLFDGSKLHGIYNVNYNDDQPQIALAMNIGEGSSIIPQTQSSKKAGKRPRM